MVSVLSDDEPLVVTPSVKHDTAADVDMSPEEKVYGVSPYSFTSAQLIDYC
jgi:hypothetical protein